jgi:hypothetical protein
MFNARGGERVADTPPKERSGAVRCIMGFACTGGMCLPVKAFLTDFHVFRDLDSVVLIAFRAPAHLDHSRSKLND